MKPRRDTNLKVLEDCFRAPRYALGENEANCVSKIVFLTLWELGWNPVSQILLSFQVPKERVNKPAQASNAADVVVVDGSNVFLVGEVKDWAEPLGPEEITQVRTYQKALGAPRSFLSNGHRWLIFDNSDEPRHSFEFRGAEDMLSSLTDFLGEGRLASSPFPYDNALEFGLSIKSGASRTSRKALPSCDPEDYSKPAVRAMIKELRRIKSSKPSAVGHGYGESSLMLKDLTQEPRLKAQKTIFEYRPGPTKTLENEQNSSGVDKILQRPDNLRKLGVPSAYIDEFADVTKKYNDRKIEDHGVIQTLEKIIGWLETFHK